MFNDFRWGGISVRGLIRTLLPDVWMPVAMMIITYLAAGIVGDLTYSPEYEATAVVAVYPDNKLEFADSSADRMDTASAVNGLLSGEAFLSGFEGMLVDSDKRTISSSYLESTNLLTITVVSFSAKDAVDTVRKLVAYYNDMTDYLTGDGILEIVVPPKVPLEPSNSSVLLDYRLLLALFMGFATGALPAFFYVISRTYKTAGSVRRQYRNAQFFCIPEAPRGKFGLAGRRKKMETRRQIAARKTAEELRQMLQVCGGKSILISSASKSDGNMDFAVTLAEEFSSLGRSVLLVEADFDNPVLAGKDEKEEGFPKAGILDVLGARCTLKDVCVRNAEKNILTAYAGAASKDDDIRYTYTPEDVTRVMEEATGLADIVLIDGGTWGGAGDGELWNSAADFSLVICAPGKDDFFEEDRLIEDLTNGSSRFVGIVLQGF